MPDAKTLILQTIPTARLTVPAEPLIPREPNTQESSGRPGPIRTYEDLLKTPHDEDLFEYYATSQLAFVDAMSGKTTLVGKPAIFQSADPAPDGQHLLLGIVHRPFSYFFPAFAF